MALEVYLAGLKVDLKKAEVVAITKQIVDINSFTTIRGDRSNSFNLILNDRNKRLVEYIDTVGSQSNLPYIKVPAAIIQDGVNVLPNAFASIDTVDKTINIAVFGGNVSWISALEGKTLNDLDYKDREHIWNLANVIDSHQTAGLDYLYPLVDYDKVPTRLFSSNWGANVLRPWVYFRSILERIFLQAGYTYDGDILTDPRFNGAVLECNQLKYPLKFIEAEAKIDEPIGYIDISHNPFTSSEAWLRFPTEVSDPLQASSPPGVIEEVTTIFGDRFQYNYKKKGKYYWEMRIHIQHISAQLGPNLYPGVSPIPYTIKAATGMTVENGYITSGVPVVIQFTTVNTTPIWQEQFFITPLTTYLQPGNNLWNVRVFNDSYIKCIGYEGDGTTDFGDLVNLGYMLPKIPQAEFVKCVAYMFGQAIIPDPIQQKVTFRYWDELTKRKGDAINWGKKVDTNSDPVINFRLSGWARRNWFRYAPDDTVLTGYGDGEILVNDEWLQDKRDVITLPVAACMNNSNGVPTIPRYEVPNIDILWDGEGTARVLATEESTGSITINSTTVTPYRRAWFKELNGLKNIGFDDSLLIDYYKFIKGIVNKAKIVNRNMKLDMLDILTFDPFLPVYVPQDSAYYFVNKIENWQSGKLTKTELIRL